jgi:hypothetical protein
MSRLINVAESWEKVYEAYQFVNFSAWDYITIKESLLDYLKLYHPEDFNDYIESSEFVMVIELFAYICEMLAYRFDLNAHENFITDAQRKESILRLAKFLSYKAYRNIPGRGLVKIKSISSTEKIFDAYGNDLSNRIINWNDPVDINWKEKFLMIINSALEQQFGSVLSTDRIQVQDILFELYSFNNEPVINNVIPFSVTVSTDTLNFELVSSKLTENGPVERRPEKNQKFSILHLNDGLGDSSDHTGFFILAKEGTLNREEYTFDGITSNQTIDLRLDNCNNIDLWVNNIDPLTGNIISGDQIGSKNRIGEWEEVDLANSQNIVFNTNPNRNKYEVETLANDRIRIIFGDGKFAAVPNGLFEVWFRTSANSEYVIPVNSIQNKTASFSYRDKNNRLQTLSVTLSLVDPIQNSAPSEDIESIRKIAPSVYYTQDRMVNNKDYNEFLLQDNSILKLKALNRTFAGDSKYVYWQDPRNYYENVKLFGDDLVIYFRSDIKDQTISSGDLPDEEGNSEEVINILIDNYITPIFDTEEFFVQQILNGVHPNHIRKSFYSEERDELESDLLILINNKPGTLYFLYDISNDLWTFETDSDFEEDASIILVANNNEWILSYRIKQLVVHSDEVKFWLSNDDRKIVTYDTLKTNYDEIIILSANTGVNSCSLNRNYSYRVLHQDIIDVGVNSGLKSIHDLLVIPNDEDNDGVPDDVQMSYFITNSNYVYFHRECTNCEWVWKPATEENIALYEADEENLWKREIGRQYVNFLWLHRTPRYHLVDPAPSNIIDMYIMTRGYYNAIKQWLNNKIDRKPEPPNTFQLRNDYKKLLSNKMISDSVILHPGKIKPIIGKHASDELKAKIKVIRSSSRNLTNNQIKVIIVDTVKKFFDINKWEFGQTFNFTILSAYIHSVLPIELDSVVLVPTSRDHIFGDLFRVYATDDEIIQASIDVNDIEIVETLDPKILKQTL